MGHFFSHEKECGLIFLSLRQDSWMPSLNHSSTPTVHLEKDVLMFHRGISGVHHLYGFIYNVAGKCYQHLLTAFRKIVQYNTPIFPEALPLVQHLTSP